MLLMNFSGSNIDWGMEMKTLVYINKNILKDSGGPIGYCNNIYKEAIKRNDKDVHFLDIPVVEHSETYNFLKKSKFLWVFKRNIQFFKLIYGNNHIAATDLNQYEAIHFHNPLDMYLVRDSLKDYKGICILTSHSPTLASKEALIDLSMVEKFIFKPLQSKLIRMDEYAFDKADYYIFPCEEAEEPYISDWDKFEEYKSRKSVKYVPTGTHQCVAKTAKSDIRKKYGIPNDAFVISYVGRHNEIKGYDKLKEIGEVILRETPNCYFLIAGAEHPFHGLNHDRWIEVGWTNDPHSVINASDIFVLPNKNTYFDLILLEVMSLGKPVLFTFTGGNKFMYKLNKGGLFKYSTVNEAITELKKIMKFSPSDLEKIGNTNKDIFNDNFTVSKFYENYKSVLKEIERENKK